MAFNLFPVKWPLRRKWTWKVVEVSSTLAELEESRRQTNITSNVYATRTTHSSVAAATFNDFRLVAERVPKIQFSGLKMGTRQVEQGFSSFFANFYKVLQHLRCTPLWKIVKYSKKWTKSLFNLPSTNFSTVPEIWVSCIRSATTSDAAGKLDFTPSLLLHTYVCT